MNNFIQLTHSFVAEKRGVQHKGIMRQALAFTQFIRINRLQLNIARNINNISNSKANTK